MARGDQLGRQWRVLRTLITSKRGKSAAELADELECHPRTVYRDLEALQIAGFPIYTATLFHDSLESLFKKVKATLPKKSLAYLDEVQQVLHVGLKPYKEYGKFRESF